jgi:hypothetical protein
LVLLDHGIINHAYAGRVNSFTHLRVPLVLHDRGTS